VDPNFVDNQYHVYAGSDRKKMHSISEYPSNMDPITGTFANDTVIENVIGENGEQDRAEGSAQ